MRWAQVRHVGWYSSMVGVLILSTHVQADVRTSVSRGAESMEIAQPVPRPIDSNPVATPPIPSIAPTVPRIESAPARRAQISAPAAPFASSSLVPQDINLKVIQDEILQLRRNATPSSGYGSTQAAAQAAWQLGLIYLHGAGVRVDRPLAQQWFERSARQGRETWAFAGLAWCAIDGCSVPPNPALATPALARLRSEHPARADYLAWIQATRLKPLKINGPGVSSQSVTESSDLQLLDRAAQRGDVQANIELGIMAYANKQTAKAEAYFSSVAARSTIAANNLQHLRSLDTAPAPLSRPSVSDDSAESALNMARMYHRGEGVPANYSEALRFYRLAEQRGSAEAHRMIELIFSMPNGVFDPVWMQQLARANLSLPASMIAAGITAQQLRREASPLSDLLTPRWKARLQKVAQ